MRWIWVGWLCWACGGAAEQVSSQPHEPETKAAVETPTGSRADVTLEAFVPLHAEGVQVVDVRTPGEWEQGHVPGAVHVPLGELAIDHPGFAKLDKSKPIYFICAAGGRSARAADQMAALGIQAINVMGGTGAWIAAGHGVE